MFAYNWLTPHPAFAQHIWRPPWPLAGGHSGQVSVGWWQVTLWHCGRHTVAHCGTAGLCGGCFCQKGEREAQLVVEVDEDGRRVGGKWNVNWELSVKWVLCSLISQNKQVSVNGTTWAATSAVESRASRIKHISSFWSNIHCQPNSGVDQVLIMKIWILPNVKCWSVSTKQTSPYSIQIVILHCDIFQKAN